MLENDTKKVIKDLNKLAMSELFIIFLLSEYGFNESIEDIIEVLKNE